MSECFGTALRHELGSLPSACDRCHAYADSYAEPDLTAAIEQRVKHHPPSSDDVVAAHSDCRNRFGDLEHWVNATVPAGDDKRRALEALDVAMMLTNSAIARTQLTPLSNVGIIPF